MTIASVAPATPPVGTVDTGAGAAGIFGEPSGDIFADLLGASPVPVEPAELTDAPASTGSVEVPALPAVADSAPPTGLMEVLSAAQIMAAAQVVPVTPVLAAALALRAGTAVAAEGTPAAVGGAPTVVAASSQVVPWPTTSTDVPAAAVSAAVSDQASTVASVSPTQAQSAPQPVTEPAVRSGAEAAPGSAAEADRPAKDADRPATDGARPPTTEALPVATTWSRSTTPHGRPSAPSEGRVTDTSAAPVTQSTAGQPPAGQPTPTAPPLTQPVLAGAAPAPAAGPAGQVNGQVFPEVARLVSRGDGTHRITIKLSPEALGDVRVVLTVRDGEVHVRMTGGEAAQQALRAGTPELHRLLDLTGAASTQVVVGDQGSTLDSGRRDGPSTHHPQDHRTAGTRDGDTSARDGISGGPQSQPSTDPTATRGDLTRTLRGVDVTM